MNQPGASVTAYFALMLAASIVAVISRRTRIPYALALVVTGLVIGLLHLLPAVRLDPHILFTVFLPPLLFESALGLRLSALRREWKPIAFFALGVTISATFAVGYLAAWALRMPLPVALVFGALISATDPISVIAVFKQLGANRRLALLLDAEALFNDGIAFVLFTVLVASAGSHGAVVTGGIGLFLVNTLGGIAVGALIGFGASRLSRHLDDNLLAITLTTIVAFGAYLAADALSVSGVLAVVVAGVVFGDFGLRARMTPTTRLAVSAFWEFAAFAVNSVVFLLIGLEEARADLLHAVRTVAIAALIVLAGRLSIYPITWLGNRLGAGVPFRFQHVLVWGGLRGALSLALAISIAPDFPYRATVVTATFGAVLASLLIQGLSIGPLLRRLGLINPSSVADDRESAHLAALRIANNAAIAEIERVDGNALYPDWAITALRLEYAARADAILAAHSEAEDLDRAEVPAPERPSVRAQALRTRIVHAEQAALRDAEHEGLVEPATAQALITRLDAQVFALTPTSHG
jgi:CPA1 family monovalent cation:H+ antiporter